MQEVIDKNIEDKIIINTKWITSSISKNNMYRLENNIILEYLSKEDVPKKYYKIFNLMGEDYYCYSFNTFNECLVVIALNLGLNDIDTLKYLNISKDIR